MTAKPNRSGAGAFFAGLLRHQIMIPLAAMLLLTIFHLIVDRSFFSISLMHNVNGDPVLTGSIISVIDSGSELAILAIGMTLVTAASGGQDISVGAGIAISGSVILRVLCGTNPSPEHMQAPIIVAFLIGCLAAAACGAFNGALVAFFRLQPMVATLILFTAGRSIAAWVNNNRLPVVNDIEFKYFGGYIPGIPIPTPFLIAIVCFIVTWAMLKFTNIGLYAQAVGINEKTSRLNGLNPAVIKLTAYVILGLCVGVCGLIKTSRVGSINYSVIAKDIEMDAILAVALGGNALSGGKFSMSASVLGAYVIQYLTTTLYSLNVRPAAISAYKAVVVILLVVCSAPAVREKFSRLMKKARAGKPSGSAA
ncbi:MAG: ABC transporter permease [Oscillospiraceae bacterium]|nr:ABC transporter permease [Oscillospiraceae bacterium]